MGLGSCLSVLQEEWENQPAGLVILEGLAG